MNLGLLLSLGDSLEQQEQSGQFWRFEKYYLTQYLKKFKKVYVFSYSDNKKFQGDKKFKLVPNKFGLHRLIYTFLLPILESKNIRQVSIVRAMQATGAIPAIIARLFYKIPYVVTYGYKYHQFAKVEGKLMRSFLFKILEYFAVKFANGIIVTTYELKKYVGKYTSEEKIHLIPNGVDTKTFKPITKEFNPKNIQVLSIGRLEVQKNYQNLIRAVSISKFKNEISLRIIGRGGLKNSLEYLANTLDVNLNIIEPVPNNQIPKYLNQSDIFVLPSLIEGHPKTLIEALSCGIPSIVSKVTGNIEIVKDHQNGLFCQISPEDIAQKLDLLIENKNLRRNISQTARKDVLAKYNIEKLVNREILLLKSLSHV